MTNYNYAQYVGEAIESVLNQTYQNFEIIVVDDGSTDNSKEVLSEYERGHSDKVKVIYKENGGQASGFNAGFSAASGEIIAFLDADDYWYSNKLETVVKYHKTHAGIQHNLLINNKIPFALLEDEVAKQKEMLEKYGSFGTIPTSGLSFRRQSLRGVFPIPEEYKVCADLYLKMFFLQEGFDLYSLNKAYGNYRHHDNNIWFNNQGIVKEYNEITLKYLNDSRKSNNQPLISRLKPAEIYVKTGLQLQSIPKESRIGIYGTGGLALELYYELIKNGYDVLFFTNSEERNEQSLLEGLPVVPFQWVNRNQDEYDLLIIASSAQTEIIYELQKSNFPKEKYRGLTL